MDRRAPSSLCVAMDDETRDLISRLGTRVGVIMEDCSVTALTLGRMDETDLGSAVDTLVHAGTSISVLAAALSSLVK